MKKRELYAAKIADQVVLQNDVLQPQDFVRLRVLTGFADIPIDLLSLRVKDLHALNRS